MQTAEARAAFRATLDELQRSDHDRDEVVLDSGPVAADLSAGLVRRHPV